MAARDLVFQPCDRVRASGRFVSGPDGDWLDVQRVHDLMIKPLGWKSELSIRLFGADAAAVPSQFGPNQVPGHITVVGRWHAPATEDQQVLVVATTDVEAVTRRLSPSIPNQFCVVRSRFTRVQLDEVPDVLHAHFQEWRLESFGTGHSDPQGQPFATAEPVRVTPELAAWADTLPKDLLLLHPTITPA